MRKQNVHDIYSLQVFTLVSQFYAMQICVIMIVKNTLYNTHEHYWYSLQGNDKQTIVKLLEYNNNNIHFTENFNANFSAILTNSQK